MRSPFVEAMIGTGGGGGLSARLRGEAAGAVAIAAAIAFTALSDGGYGVVFSAVAGLAIWWALLCVLALHRDAAGEVPRPALAAMALLATYSLWALLSAFWAADAAGAIYEAAKLLAYLGAFCGAVLLARHGSGRMWVAGLAGGLMGIAAIALAVRFFPSIEGDRETLQAALPSAQGRLGFPIGYWNALAACMAMAITLLPALAVFSRSRSGRAICTALIPLPVLVIFLASSRGGAVAAGVGVLAVLALAPGRAAIAASLAAAAPASLLITALAADQAQLLQGLGGELAGDEGLTLFLVTVAAVAATFGARFLLDQHLSALSLPRWTRRAIPAAVAVAVIAGIVAIDPAERWRDFKDPPDFAGSESSFVASHLQSGNGNGRYQFWGTALDAFADEPVTGLGAAGFGTYWNQNGPIEYRLRDAHSLVFEAASELGIIGLAAILGFFALVGWTGLRRALDEHRRAEALPEAALLIGVLAAGLAAILIDWTWEIPAVALPMLIAAALLTGREPKAGGTGGGPPRTGLIVIAVVALPVLANVFLTEMQMRESREAVASNDLTAAADAAERAEALAPWGAEPRLQAALIAERLGDLDTARAEIGEAIERSPDDWKLRVVAARFALETDDAAAAKQHLDEARRLNPRSAILLERPVPPGILPGG